MLTAAGWTMTAHSRPMQMIDSAPPEMLIAPRGTWEWTVVLLLSSVMFVSRTLGRLWFRYLNRRTWYAAVSFHGRVARRFALQLQSGLRCGRTPEALWAAQATRALGEDAPWLLPAVLDAAMNDHVSRVMGKYEIGYIGACLANFLRHHHQSLELHADELSKSPFSAVRCAAAWSISLGDTGEFRHGASATSLLSDQEERVRAEIARSLTLVGARATECANAIAQALSREQPRATPLLVLRRRGNIQGQGATEDTHALMISALLGLDSGALPHLVVLTKALAQRKDQTRVRSFRTGRPGVRKADESLSDWLTRILSPFDLVPMELVQQILAILRADFEDQRYFAINILALIKKHNGMMLPDVPELLEELKSELSLFIISPAGREHAEPANELLQDLESK